MEWTTMLNWRMWCHHIFSSRSQMATANCQSYENVRWKISLMKISITIIAAHIAFVDHFNRGKCSSIPSILHAYSSPPDTMVSMALVYVSFCIVRDTIEGMEQIDVEICCVFEIIEHYKMLLCVSELCYWQHFQRCHTHTESLIIVMTTNFAYEFHSNLLLTTLEPSLGFYIQKIVYIWYIIKVWYNHGTQFIITESASTVLLSTKHELQLTTHLGTCAPFK